MIAERQSRNTPGAWRRSLAAALTHPARLPVYQVPRLVREVPGAPFKVPVQGTGRAAAEA